MVDPKSLRRPRAEPGACHRVHGSSGACHSVHGSSGACHRVHGSSGACHRLHGSSGACHRVHGSSGACHSAGGAWLARGSRASDGGTCAWGEEGVMGSDSSVERLATSLGWPCEGIGSSSVLTGSPRPPTHSVARCEPPHCRIWGRLPNGGSGEGRRVCMQYGVRRDGGGAKDGVCSAPGPLAPPWHPLAPP